MEKNYDKENDKRSHAPVPSKYVEFNVSEKWLKYLGHKNTILKSKSFESLIRLREKKKKMKVQGALFCLVDFQDRCVKLGLANQTYLTS